MSYSYTKLCIILRGRWGISLPPAPTGGTSVHQSLAQRLSRDPTSTPSTESYDKRSAVMTILVLTAEEVTRTVHYLADLLLP